MILKVCYEKKIADEIYAEKIKGLWYFRIFFKIKAENISQSNKFVIHTLRYTYFPEECEKMKDIVKECGRFNISTIDIHGLNKLLHVCGLLKFQGIQIGFSHV